MNIGQAAHLSGMPAKTIRYYEEIGLVHPAARKESGYRAYSERDIHNLRFIKRARGLGFSIKDCQELLSLYRDKDRASADVKALTLAHIAEIEQKIAELSEMRETLATLADRCHGDEMPDCPILHGLADDAVDEKQTRSS